MVVSAILADVEPWLPARRRRRRAPDNARRVRAFLEHERLFRAARCRPLRQARMPAATFSDSLQAIQIGQIDSGRLLFVHPLQGSGFGADEVRACDGGRKQTTTEVARYCSPINQVPFRTKGTTAIVRRSPKPELAYFIKYAAISVERRMTRPGKLRVGLRILLATRP